jgi:nitrate/nitrite-specific signal transduction histidine kinase
LGLSSPAASLPAGSLDAGAGSGWGEFSHEIAVAGDDELSNLSQVFNNTASQPANLPADLEKWFKRNFIIATAN